VTVDEWATEEKHRVQRFADWWEQQRKDGVDHFPKTMPPGEWDEQYRLWDE
jgi:hypothetical protein